jgi:predicted nuclease with TOPRIM domain
MAELNIDWLVPLGTTLAAGLSLWNFIQSPSRQNAALIAKMGELIEKLKEDSAKELQQMDGKLTTLEGKVQLLDGEIRHLPDRDAAHRLELAVERLNGRIETLDERLKPVAAISDRMQEILIEQGKR